MFGNGESQSRASELPGGRAVGLGEALEDRVLTVFWNADARVRDGEAHGSLGVGLCVQFGAEDDLSRSGELDGITDQIDENLPEAPGIPHQSLRHVGKHVGEQFQPLLPRHHIQCAQGIAEAVPHLEVYGRQVEFSRFDLGEVENVIDHRQQGICG